MFFVQCASRSIVAFLVLFVSLGVYAETILNQGPGSHSFTVPATGDYTIILGGGHGGVPFDDPGGAGAQTFGVYSLTAGQTLTIQVGGNGFNSGTSAGGGAGSFAYVTADNTLLMAAGGGGGGATGAPGQNASTVNSALALSGGLVNGINGGNSSCCGTSTAAGVGGLSMVDAASSYHVGSTSISISTAGTGFVRIIRAPFIVNGTVSGLSGSGLVLQNNGADDQVITANGAFAFTGQANATPYSVSVLTQPTSPAQICSVSDGAGVISNDDIFDVAVECATREFTGMTPASTSGTVSFTSSDVGCSFSGSPQFLPPSSPPANITFPFGVVDFTVNGCTAGAQIDVTIDFGAPIPGGALAFKSDPWRGVPGATILGSTLSYSVIDGGPLDADGLVNGVIVDPIGVGVSSAREVPTASMWMLILMSSLLAMVGGIRLRREVLFSA